VLKLQPISLRESGIALGAPVWHVIREILWKSASSGILTGALLAFARISGETAPLLFTALNNQFFSLNMTKPMANLPVVIYQFALSAYDDWRRLAWAGALLIAASVLTVTVTGPIPFKGAATLMNSLAPDAFDTSVARINDRKIELDIQNVDFFYGKTQALKGVSMQIADRAVTALIGPSGCGKSTLLRVLNRMYQLYPGRRPPGRFCLATPAASTCWPPM